MSIKRLIKNDIFLTIQLLTGRVTFEEYVKRHLVKLETLAVSFILSRSRKLGRIFSFLSFYFNKNYIIEAPIFSSASFRSHGRYFISFRS